MDTYLDEIAPVLKPAIDGRDVLVVGHSLRDRRIRELAMGTGGEAVWYVSPSAVPPGLDADRRLRAVIGLECTFEALFIRLGAGFGSAGEEEALREAPMGAVAARKSLAGGQTVDDLMASVVGIAARDDTPFMTGFVLAEPRLIVADGWEGNVGQLGVGPVHIAAADGGRFTTDILLHVGDHPFGPMLLACPATLKVPGLRLNAAPVAPSSGVRFGVAAGPRVGLSSGAVATDVEATVDIAPIGRVDHLVRLDAAVAPGSSGAPVVDGSMSVRGFIVAGSTDPEQPISYFYPATRWARHVRALQPLSSDPPAASDGAARRNRRGGERSGAKPARG